jgi:hypothetical protein
MDTHVATHPDIEPGTAGMSARLPGEAHEPSAAIGELEAGECLPSAAVQPTRRRRGTLLAGVAVAAVAIAGGAFLVSPYNRLYPVPRLQTSVNGAANNTARYAQTTPRPILAPSASLAKVAVPPAPPATRDAYTPKPHDQEVAELLSFHPGSAGSGAHPAKSPPDHAAARPAPAVAAVPAAAGAPTGYVPREPGSSSVSQTPAAPVSSPPSSVTGRIAPASVAPKDATALIVASLPKIQPAIPNTQAAPAPVPVAPVQAAEPAPASASPAASQAPARQPDTLTVATNLRASPMTPPEQVQVLNLVTEMAAMVKDLRKQQAQLRADLGKSSADATARLTDFERRLALAEARSAVTAADDATVPPAKSPEPVSEPAAAPLKPIPVLAARPVAVVPAPAPSGVPTVYRVQAASPGLALLAQVDRGGGDGAQLQVVVGDTVPDYGRVKSIAQKGTAWVVTTEHGAIQ